MTINRHQRSTLTPALAALIFWIFLGLSPGSSWAAETKQANPIVSVNAREQGLTAFLNELLGAAGYSTVISSAVDGLVSGRFEGRLDTVLRDLSRKQAITFHKTGKIIYVYRTGEIGARILSTKPSEAERLSKTARRMGMFDENNFLARADNGTVVAVGTPRLLDQLDDLAQAEKAGKSQLAATSRSTQFETRAAAELATRTTSKPASTKPPMTKLASYKTRAIKSPPPVVATVPPPPAPIVSSTAAQGADSAVAAGKSSATSAIVNANAGGPIRSVLPEFTPAVIEVPLSAAIALNGNVLAQNAPTASLDRAPLRPRIVWRSAYTPPEPVDSTSK